MCAAMELRHQDADFIRYNSVVPESSATPETRRLQFVCNVYV